MQYATNIMSICEGLSRQVFDFLWLHFYGQYHSRADQKQYIYLII